MTRLVASTILILCFASFARAEEPKPIKIAIIGDTKKHLTDIDLLTVNLSANDNIHVLERSEWDYLLREHTISESNIGQSSIKIGRLLGADGLIILTEEEVKGKKYLLSKLVAVKSGIILDSIVSPVKKKSETDDWSESIKWRFEPKLAKLKNHQDKIIVSMLNIRSALSSPELLIIEKELNTIFAQRLMREENVLVSERWNIAEAAFEKNLEGKEGGLKTGSVLLDGTLSLKDKENVEVNLFITTPNAKKQEIKVFGKKDELGKLAEYLTISCLKILKITPKNIEWDIKKEALEYYKEAQWAYNTGLFFKAAQSTESAWALGCRDPNLVVLRIKCYMGAAYQSYKITKQKTKFDPSKIDKHLDAAIMALELYRHYFLRKVKINKPIPKVNFGEYASSSHWSNFGTTLVESLSALQKEAYNKKCLFKYPDKQAFLSMYSKEVDSFLRSYLKRKKWSSYDACTTAMQYAPFWCQTPKETMELYNELLSENFPDAYRPVASTIRMYLLRSEFIDRSGKYSRQKEKRQVEEYVKKLSESGDISKKMDSLTIQLYRTDKGYQFIKSNSNKQAPLSKEIIYSQIYDLYKGNKEKFWNLDSVYLSHEMVKRFTKDHKNFAYEYFYKTLKSMNNKRKWNSEGSVLKCCIKDSAFPETEVKKIRGLLNSLPSISPKVQTNPFFIGVKKAFYKKYPAQQTNTLKPDWKRQLRLESKEGPQSGAILKKNSLYGFFKKISKKTKTVQFTINIIDTKTFKNRSITYPECKLSELELNAYKYSRPLSEKNTSLYDDNFAYSSSMGLFVFNIKNKKCVKLNVPEQNYTGGILIRNKLFAFFEPDFFSKFPDSGMIEVDINTNKYKLIFASRRKPAKTSFDNIKPYRFDEMIALNDRYILLRIFTTKSKAYIYDTQNSDIKYLEKMDTAFLKKYIHSYTKMYGGRVALLSLIPETGKMQYISIIKPNTLIQKFKAAEIPSIKTKSKHMSANADILNLLFKLQNEKDSSVMLQGYLYFLNKTGDDLEKIKLIQLFPSDSPQWTINFSQFNIQDGLLLIARNWKYDRNKKCYIINALFYSKKNVEAVFKGMEK
jgi:hypothetical protein